MQAETTVLTLPSTENILIVVWCELL